MDTFLGRVIVQVERIKEEVFVHRLLLWRMVTIRWPLNKLELTSWINKNVAKKHGCPTHTIVFQVQLTMLFGSKLYFGIKNRQII